MKNVTMVLNMDLIPHEEGEKLTLVKVDDIHVEFGTVYYCENDNEFYWVLEDVEEVIPEDEQIVEVDLVNPDIKYDNDTIANKIMMNCLYGIQGFKSYPPLK